ncbi:hypothetical protein NQ314_007384 [Rhamnusium bicolor]|uniref:Uncharacterized protein n=1 Tax=Rhamnusium bicolor TaxID=1586634 RepID=A0AAV8YRE0_9CUCU|nr:hypothetical protein NQ314_007384 [Rhamnusium bicolor]
MPFLLDKVEGRYPFIILSFIIRIVEALGNAAFLTASFAIIAKEFPNNVATTFVSFTILYTLMFIQNNSVATYNRKISQLIPNLIFQ